MNYFPSSAPELLPVEVAAIDANDDPIGWRETAIELEFPLHVLILAIGHHSLPPMQN
jgi:hypothetical protein